MGIPDHCTCLLRNLHAEQEATVSTGHGSMDWFQIGKGVHQGFILSYNCHLYAGYVMQNASLNEAQGGIKTAGRKTQPPQVCRWYHRNGRKQGGNKEPLDEGERGEWKTDLKLSTQKIKIMALGPITSWQIGGGNNGKSDRFLFSYDPKSLQLVTAAMKSRDASSLEEKLWHT